MITAGANEARNVKKVKTGLIDMPAHSSLGKYDGNPRRIELSGNQTRLKEVSKLLEINAYISRVIYYGL
jgi:lipopolysaccharide export system protein LptA